MDAGLCLLPDPSTASSPVREYRRDRCRSAGSRSAGRQGLLLPFGQTTHHTRQSNRPHAAGVSFGKADKGRPLLRYWRTFHRIRLFMACVASPRNALPLEVDGISSRLTPAAWPSRNRMLVVPVWNGRGSVPPPPFCQLP